MDKYSNETKTIRKTRNNWLHRINFFFSFQNHIKVWGHLCFLHCMSVFCTVSLSPFPELGCQQCANGWLRLGQSCFYLSRFRLSWDESQRNCTARGGSLAVIDSLGLQNFLTKEGKMKYWIGLRRQGATWTWVNNAALRQSYWGDNMPEEACGILSSEGPPEKNWMRASCEFYTYFICQVQLQ